MTSFRLPRHIRYRLQRSATAGPVVLAVIVGLLAGAWAILFRWLIRAVQWALFDQGSRIPAQLNLPGMLQNLHVLLAPAIGMVVVVLIVRRWAPEARGHGVPEVQYAVRASGGNIRARVASVKALASAISIGSGGSVGREGPIVQIGSTLGSVVGRVTGLGSEQKKLLVACGAAGGVGATFNAPIAGVLFALEVILGNFAARSFGLVVVASVTATALSRAVLGPEPAFSLLHRFALVSPRELFLYLILGSLLGLLATLYVRSIYTFEELFERWGSSAILKAVAGGLTIGAMGFFGTTLVFGVGYEGMELALASRLSLQLMLALVFLKILATSVTLAAGGSGGVFAPALFIGAMAGGAFGAVANGLFPGWTAPSGAYALVGMAAVFGAAAHAPITAVLILFEMTDDYLIILPLMLAVGVAYLTQSHATGDSIYSVKLRRLGGLEGPEREVSVLDMLLVVDAMSEEYETVSEDLQALELAARARSRRTRSWPVTDPEGKLIGIVADTDLELGLIETEGDSLTVADVMTTTVITLRPQDTMRVAFRRFSMSDVQQIPVVTDEQDRQLVGVLRRYDMLWAYKTLSDEHDQLLEKGGGPARLSTEGVVQIDFEVPPEDRRLIGRRLKAVTLPPDSIITLIRRGDRIFVPHGGTRVEAGDILYLLTTREHEAELKSWTG
jgi:CIC family chloride channel protein